MSPNKEIKEARKRKAIYLRSISGIKKGLIQQKRICFLTLTTNKINSQGLTDEEKFQLLRRSWKGMQKTITRKGIKIEFLTVITNEGGGVIHVLLIGLPYIWIKTLQRWWESYHGMGFVWITKFKGNAEAMSRYLMSQYLANQKCIFRFKMSNNFICPQFTKYWKIIKNCSRDITKTPKRVYDYTIHPINFNELKNNYELWITNYIKRGELLDYIP